MAIYPITSTEQLLYSTVMIKTSTGSGTGFFYNFDLESNVTIPTIITNKHVINHNEKEQISITFHTGSAINKVIDKGSIQVNLSVEWHFHPNHDLCFTFLGPIIDFVLKKYNKNIFYVSLNRNNFWLPNELEKLSAVEDVLMVGYPIGLWDKKNNLPLFRRGITASHPGIDFEKKDIGVVDMACFPGSSGSPIFIDSVSAYHDKDENKYVLGKKRSIFLGILYSGPIMNSDGVIEVEEIPTKAIMKSVTPLMINLGYYIKANQLLEFYETVNRIYDKSKKISEGENNID
jgi:V8-like Glu-specific endopeptidase